jgi:WD repeat and SOF domain-containing protein 1
MKIKVLQRSEREHVSAPGEVQRVYRNPDPQLHPFERAREYQRALKAVKMGKIFAKPFIRALDGHTDSVKCMTMARRHNAALVSGSCAGELRVWDMQQLTAGSIVEKAHEGFVRDVCTSMDGSHVFSCGDDKAAKMWVLDNEGATIRAEPKATFHASTIPNSIDHHWQKPMFVTTGDTVDVWDYNRSAPLSSFEWGCDRVITARFNPAEPSLIASTAVDRSIGLFDLRGNSAIRKVILKMRSNGVRWNPMQPMNFTVANEDCNLYTFDMRKLTKAISWHWDHVLAVIDLCYSPTGQEFVSASYDQTVRLWSVDASRSRDVYHGKRMQRVLCCAFSSDSRFVFSGSEDTNIRVWKTKADQKLGVLTEREKHAVAYRDKLVEKFSRLPEIKRIKRYHHVPKFVKSLSEKRRVMRDARDRKNENRRKHSKPGTVPHVGNKKRHIVKELE